jgi:hypothetical protein
MARPKKTLNDLPKDWKEKCFNMYKKGYSTCEIVSEIFGISYHTFLNFKKNNKEFLQSIKELESFSKSWWMKKGRENVDNKDFNATLWYMNMKNRFGWKDKQEIKHDGSMVSVNISKKESEV